MCEEGGGGALRSGAGVNRAGVILLVQLKMRSCIKFCNHFRRVVYFVVLQFPSYKKETKEESIIRQISFLFNQNDGIPNQHNMVLAVLSP